MPDIKHLGYGSLAIQVNKEKQVVLGPRETKDISVDEFESEGVQKSIREGLIAVLPEPAQAAEKNPKPKINPN
jgi:hypothetical protein